jgi:hypothetical protein
VWLGIQSREPGCLGLTSVYLPVKWGKQISLIPQGCPEDELQQLSKHYFRMTERPSVERYKWVPGTAVLTQCLSLNFDRAS